MIAAAAPAVADSVTYRDGRTVRCVIETETPSALTVTLHGRRIEIPRSLISGAAREGAAENEALRAAGEAKTRGRRGAAAGRAGEPRGAASSPSADASPPSAPGAASAWPPAAKPGAGKAGAKRQKRPAPPDRRRELQWREEVRNAIREKRVVVGMTEREVNRAWGSPERTHPVHGIGVSSDRWTYRRGPEGLVDLYFKNGVLTHVGR